MAVERNVCMKKILLICFCCCFTLANSAAAPVSFFLSDLQEFSGLSADTILLKREVAVETSPLFELLGKVYSPNPKVFQIEDKAPWISAYEISCYGMDGNYNIDKGPSRESLGILNPELLLHLEVLNYAFYNKGKECSPVDYLIPYTASYDPDKKLITARIDYSAFLQKNKSYYNASLMDANARDLGYNYVFAVEAPQEADETSSRFLWKEARNVTNTVIQTGGYYHLGKNVCQEIGGCNNYSPPQPGYEFYVKKLPAELHFKLWKNLPSSVDDAPDISYHLIFD